MIRLINQMIMRMLTSFFCCFFLVNTSYLFATIKPEKKDFSRPGDNYHFFSGMSHIFRLPSDIALNTEGNVAMIVNTEDNTGRAVGLVTGCIVHEGKWFTDCGYDIESWKPVELKYGFIGLTFSPANLFVFATSNYHIAGFNTLWRCRLGIQNMLVECQSDFGDYASHFNGSDGLVIDAKGSFAYIVNHNLYPPESAPVFKISRCRFDTLKWHFSDCTEMDIPGLNYPTGITLNSSGTLAFIANTGFAVNGSFPHANAVIRCDVNVITGEFTDCRDTGGTGFSIPRRVALNREDTRAFVASSGSDDIMRCVVDVSGNFSNCKSTGTGFHNPTAIVLNKDNTAAFITNSSSNTVNRCLVDRDGNFSACRDVFSRELVVSVVDAKGNAVSFLNLRNMVNTPVLTIKNSGSNLNKFHLNADALPYVYLDASCGNGFFEDGDKCQLHLRKNALSKEDDASFNVRLFNGDDLLYEFSAGISSISVRNDAWPVTFLNAGQGAVGKLEFLTSTDIKKVSFQFSNPQMAHFFQGECFNISSLKAGASCSLEYVITDNSINGEIEGFIIVNREDDAIYRLPVSISNTSILKVSDTSLPRYNTTKVVLHNVSDKPVTHLHFFNFNPGVKLVNDGCHGFIEAGKSCALSYFANVNKSVASDLLRIQAAGVMSVNVNLSIKKVPESKVVVNNKGGYVLRTYYPKLNADGSIDVGKTGDILKEKSKTIYVATFNDPGNLPDSIVSVKNIKLDIVASAINRYLPACNGGQIRCTRATVNARCYYVNRTVKEDGYGCIE